MRLALVEGRGVHRIDDVLRVVEQNAAGLLLGQLAANQEVAAAANEDPFAPYMRDATSLPTDLRQGASQPSRHHRRASQ